MEQSGQLSYFLFTFLPWDAPLGRRRLRGCSLWHRRFFRFCPASDLESAHQKRQQGGEKPSPSRLRRATSPERERLWQGRKVCSLTADFFLPLTNEDETCPLCQGLALRESCRRRRLRGFAAGASRLKENPQTSRPCQGIRAQHSQSEQGQNRKKRLCQRHTARFCPGDLRFGVTRGEQLLVRCGERGVQRVRGGSRNTPLTLWSSGASRL